MRQKLEGKTFPLFGVAKSAKKFSMTAYVNLCNCHVAAMEALSVIELNGVKDLETNILVNLAESFSHALFERQIVISHPPLTSSQFSASTTMTISAAAQVTISFLSL